VGDYERSWAVRNLREAMVNLSIARERAEILAVKHFSAIAMRKAQLAIQYVLGEPGHLDAVVTEAFLGRPIVQEPVLDLLAAIRAAIGRVSDPQSPFEKESVLKVAEVIFNASSSIVEAAIGQRLKLD